MPVTLAAFALHVDDVDRARAFYGAVFGWEFEAWGPPGFFLIRTGDPTATVEGILHTRSEPRTGTGMTGVEPTFAVEDLAHLAAVEEAAVSRGATVTVPATAIPTVGTLLRFLDPDGNDVGAMAYESRS